LEDRKLIAIAGGSGFIGRAIVGRLSQIPGLRVRVLSRNPDKARATLPLPNTEFIRAEITDPATLGPALAGAVALVNATQFDGYPVENPRKGLTFERVDYGGTVALLKAATCAAVGHFLYLSGAAADENSTHPGFHFKGRSERAIRESGIPYTIFRPSLVYGPEDRVLNTLLNCSSSRQFSSFPVAGDRPSNRCWSMTSPRVSRWHWARARKRSTRLLKSVDPS